ncbi:hypothetical protein CDAR_313001 [Caerostris darwini]|uniref:MutS-like protein n=1 Tax=Caerostris darwini TaxID=1538125 RepID=A0AAV4RZN9_9ARAC|nr:hypothetical protein CDAR_313001 [Caerostris darwini]
MRPHHLKLPKGPQIDTLDVFRSYKMTSIGTSQTDNPAEEPLPKDLVVLYTLSECHVYDMATIQRGICLVKELPIEAVNLLTSLEINRLGRKGNGSNVLGVTAFDVGSKIGMVSFVVVGI